MSPLYKITVKKQKKNNYVGCVKVLLDDIVIWEERTSNLRKCKDAAFDDALILKKNMKL
jgi:hypothetical protein